MTLPRYITFDCYDTLCEFLIDDVTPRILGDRSAHVSMAEFLPAYEKIRLDATKGPWVPYRDLLRQTLAEAMRRFGMEYRDEDGDAVIAAVRSWGPFPEVPPALERLRQQCKLVIISNSDDDIIADNVRHIGVPFDHVITAEQARAYKPTTPIFDYVLKTLGCDKSEILHVAQGWDYDIIPLRALGWNRVWINRYGKTGDQATYGPYVELPDLSGVPELLGI